MDRETFWELVDEARARTATADLEACAAALTDWLAERLTAAQVLEFDTVAGSRSSEADTPNLAGAMYLIEGYISDDAFMDFRDGLVLLGREVFERAVADADTLAECELVRTAAARSLADMETVLSYESITACVCEAWIRLTGGDDEDYWEAVEARDALEGSDTPAPSAIGEFWPVSDPQEARRRLPRLASMFAERFVARAHGEPALPSAPHFEDRDLDHVRAQFTAFQTGLARGRADALK